MPADRIDMSVPTTDHLCPVCGQTHVVAPDPLETVDRAQADEAPLSAGAADPDVVALDREEYLADCLADARAERDEFYRKWQDAEQRLYVALKPRK